MQKVPFHVYTMKERDYVMSLISTYGTTQHSGKETTHEWVNGSGNSQKRNSIILKQFQTASGTTTPLMTTTINDAHLSV